MYDANEIHTSSRQRLVHNIEPRFYLYQIDRGLHGIQYVEILKSTIVRMWTDL